MKKNWFGLKPKSYSSRVTLEQLEERIVLDAAVETTEEVSSVPETKTVSDTAESGGSPEAKSATTEAAADASNPANPLDQVFASGASNVLLSSDLTIVESVSSDSLRAIVVASDIEDGSDLLNAVQGNVIKITYDSSTATTDSILSAIEFALDGQVVTSIGFVSHDNGDGSFNLAKDLSISLSTMSSDLSLKEFWTAVGQFVSEDGRIDIMACDVASTDEGLALVAELEDITGRNVAASIDDTGNETYGGNWDLETDDVSVVPTYFDANEILAFEGVLDDDGDDDDEVSTVDHSSQKKVVEITDPVSEEDGGFHFILKDGKTNHLNDFQTIGSKSVKLVLSEPSEGTIESNTGESTGEGTWVFKNAKDIKKLWYSPDDDYDGSTTIKVYSKNKTSDPWAYLGYFDISGQIIDEPVNNPPTDLTLSEDSVYENIEIGTLVGTLSATDPDTGDTISYTLVAVDDQTEDLPFVIVDNQLITNANFNYEARQSYQVTARADDGNGGVIEKVFTVSVLDVNEAPEGLTLTGDSVAENSPQGTVIGTLSSTDPDAGAVVSYVLLDVDGQTDDLPFSITEDGQLLTNANFDYETDSSYDVTIRAIDEEGAFVDQVFTISVSDANDAPADPKLAGDSVEENADAGIPVGTFSADDQDGDVLTYTLISVDGSTENLPFEIVGNELRTTVEFNYEDKPFYTILVQISDGDEIITETFYINISDVNDLPVVQPVSAEVIENGLVKVTLDGSDEDQDVLTYFITSLPEDGKLYASASDALSGTNALTVGTSLNSNEVWFRPDANENSFDGLDRDFSFTYVADDGSGASEVVVVDLSNPNKLYGSGTFVVGPTDDNPDALLVLTANNGSWPGSLVLVGPSDVSDFTLNVTGTINGSTSDGAGIYYRTTEEISDRPAGYIFQIDPGLGNKFVVKTLGDSGHNQETVIAGVKFFEGFDPNGEHQFTISVNGSHHVISVDGIKVLDFYDSSFSEGSIGFRAWSNGSDGIPTTFAIESFALTTVDGGQSDPAEVSVTVIPDNSAPTDIVLNGTTIPETAPFGTVVGQFSTVDPDIGDTFTYTLLAVDGQTTNLPFSIDGNGQLITTAEFNYELKSVYTLTVRSDDGDGGVIEEVFTVTITDVNDAPFSVQTWARDLPKPNWISVNQQVPMDVGYVEDWARVQLPLIRVANSTTTDPITVIFALDDTSTGYITSSAYDRTTGIYPVDSIYDGETGVWQFTGTVSEVNAMIKKVVFVPGQDNDVNSNIRVSITDGDSDPVETVLALKVEARNDNPLFADRPAQVITYEQGADEVNIESVIDGELHRLAFSDPDTGETLTVTVQLLNTATGSFTTTFTPEGSDEPVTIESVDGLLRIENASLENVNLAVANLKFIPTEDNQTETWFEVKVWDGGEDNRISQDLRFKLDVIPAAEDTGVGAGGSGDGGGAGDVVVEQAPVQVWNGDPLDPAWVNLDQQTFEGNYVEDWAYVQLPAVRLTDTGSDDPVTVTYTLDDTDTGYLTSLGYDRTLGIYPQDDIYDAQTGVWTQTGTVSEINQVLKEVVFVPATDNDIDSNLNLNITQGDSSLAEADIALIVEARNDNPLFADHPAQIITYFEGAQEVKIESVISGETHKLAFSDPDTGETLTVRIAVLDPSAGSFTSEYQSGEETATVNSDASGILVIENKSRDEINAAVANLTFIPNPTNQIDTWFEVKVWDGGEENRISQDLRFKLDVVPNVAQILSQVNLVDLVEEEL